HSSSLLSCYWFFLCSFFFYCYASHPDLHSFPTRRSSDLTRCREKEGAICVNGDGRGRPPVLFHAGNVRVVDHLEAVAGGGFPNKGLPFAVHSKGNGSKDRCGIGIPGAVPIGTGVVRFQDFKCFVAGAQDQLALFSHGVQIVAHGVTRRQARGDGPSRSIAENSRHGGGGFGERMAARGAAVSITCPSGDGTILIDRARIGRRRRAGNAHRAGLHAEESRRLGKCWRTEKSYCEKNNDGLKAPSD